jgi:hypothetical protein
MARELLMVTVMKMIRTMTGEMSLPVLDEIRNLKNFRDLDVGPIKKNKTLAFSCMEASHDFSLAKVHPLRRSHGS